MLAESRPRLHVNTTLLLSSGIPIGVSIEAPAKTVIRGLAWATEAEEGTAANRTHLWVALLNSKLEVVARSADFTSNTNTQLTGGVTPHGLPFEASYETGASPEMLYGVLCEVMSSTNPITIAVSNTTRTGLAERAPRLTFLGETGRTTPASLASTVVPSAGTANQAYMALF